MKRFGCAVGMSAIAIASFALAGRAAGRFDQKLPADKRVAHVLSRLTFGPRPGDAAAVRRLGVAKWLDLQLHSDRIPENPLLGPRLNSLQTLSLPTWEILSRYTVANPVARPASASALASLTTLQRSQIMSGSQDERRAALAALSPDVRRLVMAGVPEQALLGLPEEWVQEAANIRKKELDDRQQAIRRLMPPLTDLLSPDQVRTVTRGAPQDKRALIDGLAVRPAWSAEIVR